MRHVMERGSVMKKIQVYLKKAFMVLMAVALVGMPISSKVKAAETGEAEYTIKIANSNAPFTSINGQNVIDAINAGCYAFKDYVEQNSGGKIKVEIYDSGVLGGSSEGLTQCMQNVVQACVTGDGELSTLYPKLQVLSVPYLFDNRTEFYSMLDSDWMATLFEDMKGSLGIRLLASSDNGGFRSISNNIREIKTAEDLKGLKIRCMQVPAYTTMLESMGAIATPIAWAELYTSLQTGVVDGEENAPTTILNGSLQEVQKYYTLDQHSISSLVFMMNEEFYGSLPEDLQKVITDGGNIAQLSMRGANNANEELALQGLIDSGLQVYTPTAEEKATFKDASQEPVVEWLKEEIGTDYVDSFMAAVEAAKTGEVVETTAVSSNADETAATSDTNTTTVVAIAVAVVSLLFAAFTMAKSKKKDSAKL